MSTMIIKPMATSDMIKLGEYYIDSTESGFLFHKCGPNERGWDGIVEPDRDPPWCMSCRRTVSKNIMMTYKLWKWHNGR